jgi:response regulator RpfG family c-di-GMP phosphodiesterase
MKSCLKEKGHRVLLAVDGEQGIALADREEPDLIILAIDMPGMNGYEVSAALAEQPHTAFIPILMLSESRDPEETNRILNGFANDVMIKPLEPSELLARAGAMIRCTHRLTHKKRVHHWVVRQLSDNALRRGYQVYSRHLENVPNAPLDWGGPLPDLLIKRGKIATAYLIESVESLHDDKAISRWQALERWKVYSFASWPRAGRRLIWPRKSKKSAASAHASNGRAPVLRVGGGSVE